MDIPIKDRVAGQQAADPSSSPTSSPAGSPATSQRNSGQPNSQPSSQGGGFLSDIATLRERARKHIEDGAVTENYGADRQTVLKLLNEALATELVCVLRYRRHHFMAKGIHAESVSAEFKVHADEEQAHADRIAARIVQLGGEPDFSPDGLSARSHSQYVEAGSLKDMIKENLVAERIAIESYREMVQYLGDRDSTTRRMLEEILAVEEEHADELADMLADG